MNSGLSFMRNPLTASEDAQKNAAPITGYKRKKITSGHPGLCQCLICLAKVFKLQLVKIHKMRDTMSFIFTKKLVKDDVNKSVMRP